MFWIGLLWRHMTVAGAWCTTLTGFAAWWISTQSWFVTWLASMPNADGLRLLWTEGEKTVMYLPWQILFYMSAATVVGIFVSLCTPRVNEEKLNRFYSLSRTPVGIDETIAKPCTLPDCVLAAERRMLTTALGLEVPMPSKTSILGFLVTWSLAAAMVFGFLWIVS